MARGGRSRGRGMRNPGQIFETQIDLLEKSSTMVPQVISGTYNYTGNQMSFQTQMQVYMNIDQQHMMMNNGIPISMANITIVGNKVKSGSSLCFCLTSLFSCLIFPIFFMCCLWWKKIVFPAYEINEYTYRNLAKIVNMNSGVISLNLTVVDNAFNAQKARILHGIIGSSRLTGFVFCNRALACNYNGNEIDDFAMNMSLLKSLSTNTSYSWGEIVG